MWLVTMVHGGWRWIGEYFIRTLSFFSLFNSKSSTNLHTHTYTHTCPFFYPLRHSLLASLTSRSGLTRLSWQPRDTRLTRLSTKAGCSHIANTRLARATRTTLRPWEPWETFLSKCAKPSIALEIKGCS